MRPDRYASCTRRNASRPVWRAGCSSASANSRHCSSGSPVCALVLVPPGPPPEAIDQVSFLSSCVISAPSRPAFPARAYCHSMTSFASYGHGRRLAPEARAGASSTRRGPAIPVLPVDAEQVRSVVELRQALKRPADHAGALLKPTPSSRMQSLLPFVLSSQST
jgi:hypothetical protein